MTSKLNRICVKFSKIKVTMFTYDLCQHLSIAIFHAKNGLTHNYCEFYKWEWLIYVRFRTIIYTLKYERSWYIDEDQNTYTNETWTREHNPKNKYKITNLQIQEIPHSTCVVLVSIFCILRYLQHFGVLYIGIWTSKKV